MATASRSTHYPALDGLRGLAILGVMVEHLAPQLLAGGGWVGVDLFFVLSGFLITGVLLDGKDDPHRARTFYVRRALRIFPLYYATLALITFGPLAKALALGLPARALGWYWIYGTNWQIALDMAHVGGPIAYFWSLAVEEQFYLIWPLIIWHTERKTAVRIAIIAIGLSTLSRFVLGAMPGVSAFTVYVLTPCRLDGLAIGALVALLMREPEGLRVARRIVLPLATLGGAIVVGLVLARGSFDNSDSQVLTIGLLSIALAFGGVLTLALTHAPRVLARGPLAWIGARSYGLYVLHPLVTRMLNLHTSLRTGSPVYTAVAVTASVALAAASYAGFERPILSLKNRWAPLYAGRESRLVRADPRGVGPDIAPADAGL